MSANAKVRTRDAWWVLTVVLSVGCVDTLLVPAGATEDPQANFDALWKGVDRNWAFFEQKGIDWNALYQQYRSRVAENTKDRELFRVMSELLDNLQDGHVNLWTPVGTYAYTAWYDQYPENFVWTLARAQIISPVHASPSGRIVYGHLTSEIGYAYVPSFEPSWADDMDAVLDALPDVSALVLDVRNNGGGSTDAIPAIIGRFVDERRVYARHRYRDGPDHDDFSDFFDVTVEPRGPRFQGPVAVLTNRRCFSTTEDFLLAVRVIPTMFTVGDTTGGGHGNPVLRELPNGWTFRVSRWLTFLPDGQPVKDGQGVAPDYPVQMTQVDVDRGVDTVIARAVEVLEERLSAH